MTRRATLLPATLLAAALLCLGAATASAEPLRLITTTTVEDSGLLDHLVEAYRGDTGALVIAVVRGTGEALALARRGDADATLTHDPDGEILLVADGHGLARIPVMRNDFVVVGPGDDPANVAEAADAVDAFARIAGHGAGFVSRGDDSGTHRRERAIWLEHGRQPDGARDGWYIEAGAGMGFALNVAVEREAYVLADRATWLAFGSKDGHDILFAGDIRLTNVYAVIVIDPARHSNANYEAATRFLEWIIGSDGQAAIAGFEVGGETPFAPVSPE